MNRSQGEPVSAGIDARRTDPEVDELADRLRVSIGPLARQLRQQVGPFSASQLSALGSIDRQGPLTLGELAARERLSPPMISKLVATLEEHGLIERLADPTDRRVCRVRLSATGQRWAEDSRSRLNSWLAHRLATLEEPDLRALSAALPALERLIDDGS